jgi:hypothetical protein
MSLSPLEIDFYAKKVGHSWHLGEPVALIGPPSTVKTIVARRAYDIYAQQPLSGNEAQGVIDAFHAANLAPPINQNNAVVRPFRAPHYTVSTPGMSQAMALARSGVLYLDSFNDFPDTILDMVLWSRMHFKLVVAADGLPKKQPKGSGFYPLFMLNATERMIIWEGLNLFNKHHGLKLHPDARTGPANMQNLIDDYLNQDHTVVCGSLEWLVRNPSTSGSQLDPRFYEQIMHKLYCPHTAFIQKPSGKTERERWMEFMKPPPLPDDYEGGGFLGLPSFSRRRGRRR